MMWPFRRRSRRKAEHGNGHAAREALEGAQQRLHEAKTRSREVDRLASEVRRALGSHR